MPGNEPGYSASLDYIESAHSVVQVMSNIALDTLNQPNGKNNFGTRSLNVEPENADNLIAAMFRHVLLANLRDGVVFLDTNRRISVWNAAAEQMTGLGGNFVGTVLTPPLLRMMDVDRQPITDQNDPIAHWMAQGESGTQRVIIAGRSGRELQVDFHFHPVKLPNGTVIGGLLLLVDTSVQIELQRQLNDLYSLAVLDPLTQVANRAEFERLLEEYVATHQQVGMKCSIIVCDMDYFKQVNDNFGHHIGDQALVAFAQLLKQHVRGHDFVARYGGEEFVILCAHCDESAAAERANEIRRQLEKTPQPMLKGKTITASFGVSDLQIDDDATSLFVRADKALLHAKESGRNRVIKATTLTKKQLTSTPPRSAPPTSNSAKPTAPAVGSSAAAPTISPPPESPNPSVTHSLLPWRELSGHVLSAEEFASIDPPVLFFKKLEGMLGEMSGQLVKASQNHISMRLEFVDPQNPKRRGNFVLEIDTLSVDQAKNDMVIPKDTKLLIRIAVLADRRSWFGKNDDSLATILSKRVRGYLALDNENLRLRSLERATVAKSRY